LCILGYINVIYYNNILLSLKHYFLEYISTNLILFIH
jgi:hypothetical protein